MLPRTINILNKVFPFLQNFKKHNYLIYFENMRLYYIPTLNITYNRKISTGY